MQTRAETMDVPKVLGSAKDKQEQIAEKDSMISPSLLGSSEFRKDYNIKYAYLTGGMIYIANITP